MSDWKLKGDEITWRGRLWYKGDRPDIAEYMARCEARYPNDTPGILLGSSDNRPAYRQGGPWRYTLPDGTTGVIHTQRKADALGVLRHELGRKRLPAGTTWEIVK